MPPEAVGVTAFSRAGGTAACEALRGSVGANVGCSHFGLVRWEIEAGEVWFATAVAMPVARLVDTACGRPGVQAIALGMIICGVVGEGMAEDRRRRVHSEVDDGQTEARVVPHEPNARDGEAARARASFDEPFQKPAATRDTGWLEGLRP